MTCLPSAPRCLAIAVLSILAFNVAVLPADQADYEIALLDFGVAQGINNRGEVSANLGGLMQPVRPSQ